MKSLNTKDLKKIISKSERELLRLVKLRHGSCEVGSFEDIEINPKYLSFWIKTNSERKKMSIANDKELENEIRKFMGELGYSIDALMSIGIQVESQETVDRDFSGNWLNAFR